MKTHYTHLLKTEAQRLGFLSCGISKAVFLETEAPRLEQWLKNSYQGHMGYMENHFDKRLDPRKLVEGAKSVVSLLFNYYPAEFQEDNTYKIAKYAYGEDYHGVIKDKLHELLHTLTEQIGAISGRVFVDSAPVLERAWAAKSGLGWVGKNTNLITPKTGSFYFIAELIIDLELDYDYPTTNHCGTCTACIDACPTEAIIQPYILDAQKCISYTTIELKENIPAELNGKLNDWIFGCDICQDVCPWNRFAKPTQEPRFLPNETIVNYTKNDWRELTEEVFKKTFQNSPLKRAKFQKFIGNIQATKLK